MSRDAPNYDDIPRTGNVNHHYTEYKGSLDADIPKASQNGQQQPLSPEVVVICECCGTGNHACIRQHWMKRCQHYHCYRRLYNLVRMAPNSPWVRNKEDRFCQEGWVLNTHRYRLLRHYSPGFNPYVFLRGLGRDATILTKLRGQPGVFWNNKSVDDLLKDADERCNGGLRVEHGINPVNQGFTDALSSHNWINIPGGVHNCIIEYTTSNYTSNQTNNNTKEALLNTVLFNLVDDENHALTDPLKANLEQYMLSISSKWTPDFIQKCATICGLEETDFSYVDPNLDGGLKRKVHDDVIARLGKPREPKLTDKQKNAVASYIVKESSALSNSVKKKLAKTFGTTGRNAAAANLTVTEFSYTDAGVDIELKKKVRNEVIEWLGDQEEPPLTDDENKAVAEYIVNISNKLTPATRESLQEHFGATAIRRVGALLSETDEKQKIMSQVIALMVAACPPNTSDEEKTRLADEYLKMDDWAEKVLKKVMAEKQGVVWDVETVQSRLAFLMELAEATWTVGHTDTEHWEEAAVNSYPDNKQAAAALLCEEGKKNIIRQATAEELQKKMHPQVWEDMKEAVETKYIEKMCSEEPGDRIPPALRRKVLSDGKNTILKQATHKELIRNVDKETMELFCKEMTSEYMAHMNANKKIFARELGKDALQEMLALLEEEHNEAAGNDEAGLTSEHHQQTNDTSSPSDEGEEPTMQHDSSDNGEDKTESAAGDTAAAHNPSDADDAAKQQNEESEDIPDSSSSDQETSESSDDSPGQEDATTKQDLSNVVPEVPGDDVSNDNQQQQGSVAETNSEHVGGAEDGEQERLTDNEQQQQNDEIVDDNKEQKQARFEMDQEQKKPLPYDGYYSAYSSSASDSSSSDSSSSSSSETSGDDSNDPPYVQGEDGETSDSIEESNDGTLDEEERATDDSAADSSATPPESASASASASRKRNRDKATDETQETQDGQDEGTTEIIDEEEKEQIKRIRMQFFSMAENEKLSVEEMFNCASGDYVIPASQKRRKLRSDSIDRDTSADADVRSGRIRVFISQLSRSEGLSEEELLEKVKHNS